MKCEECDEEFHSAKDFSVHRRREHGKGKSKAIQCPKCSKTFKMVSYYIF